MIDTETRLKLEAQIRARCAAGERDQAATLLIEYYVRELLPIDDQTLLILRVNRKLNWKDIARVMAPTLEASDAALEKESARLRKRFQLVAERLRRMALREGLVGADGG